MWRILTFNSTILNSHIPENPDLKLRFLSLFLYYNRTVEPFFKWQKQMAKTKIFVDQLSL